MKEKKVLFIFIIYLIVLIISPKRYLWYLPSIPIYSNNEDEADIVNKLTKERNIMI